MSENKPLRPPRAERPSAAPSTPELPMDQVEDAIRGIRYGVVQITIQDGHIIQIEKTEKIRLK